VVSVDQCKHLAAQCARALSNHNSHDSNFPPHHMLLTQWPRHLLQLAGELPTPTPMSRLTKGPTLCGISECAEGVVEESREAVRVLTPSTVVALVKPHRFQQRRRTPLYLPENTTIFLRQRLHHLHAGTALSMSTLP